jgi:glutathione S-transferase
MELDVLLAPSGKEMDAAKKKLMRQELAKGPLASWFAHLEKLLSLTGSGFIVGSRLSIADLATYCRLVSFVGGKYDDIPPGVVDGYPLLKKLYSAVEEIPKVKEWNSAHP